VSVRLAVVGGGISGLTAAYRLRRELGPDATLLVNLSGRGDKDVETAGRWFGLLDEEGER